MIAETPNCLPAAAWLKYFDQARVLADDLAACKSARQKAIKIGMFLGQWVGRPVQMERNGCIGTATLRVNPGRSNQRNYYFEVRWNSTCPTPLESETPACGPQVEKTPKTDNSARGTTPAIVKTAKTAASTKRPATTTTGKPNTSVTTASQVKKGCSTNGPANQVARSNTTATRTPVSLPKGGNSEKW